MNSDQRFAEALARLREDAARLGQLLADYEELERRMGDRDSRGFQSQAVADATRRSVPNFQEWLGRSRHGTWRCHTMSYLNWIRHTIETEFARFDRRLADLEALLIARYGQPDER